MQPQVDLPVRAWVARVLVDLLVGEALEWYVVYRTVATIADLGFVVNVEIWLNNLPFSFLASGWLCGSILPSAGEQTL
jgi:hypothetical protein